MCERTLPEIEWKYRYGLDVLFHAVHEIKYCGNSPVDVENSQLFVHYSTVLQPILKRLPFKDALQEISQLPQGEILVRVLTYFCDLPREDMSKVEPVCVCYYAKEKEKLLMLDKIAQREWPRQPFEVYILSVKAGQSFIVGRTSSIFENVFFIPFQKKSFMDSVTHELIHFKIADMVENLFTDAYQKIIAQEVAVRLLDIYLNKKIGRHDNIFYKKVEMAALGELSVFVSCLKKIEEIKALESVDIEMIKSVVAERCCITRKKEINLNLSSIFIKNPSLIKDFFWQFLE